MTCRVVTLGVPRYLPGTRGCDGWVHITKYHIPSYEAYRYLLLLTQHTLPGTLYVRSLICCIPPPRTLRKRKKKKMKVRLR